MPRFDEQRRQLMAAIRAHTEQVATRIGKTALDKQVFRAMTKVPRHEFVPVEVQSCAYLDTPLPIGFGKTISQPFMVAVMTDLLELKPDDAVLEIGTGLATIAWRLRERGYIVMYGGYRQDRAFAADACAHPADRIVVIGHSFGAEAAARVASQAAACGARNVTMVGVDPAAPSAVSGVSHAVNFVGEYRSSIAGAQNIPVPGYTHMGIMESPAVQERILSEVQ